MCMYLCICGSVCVWGPGGGGESVHVYNVGL